MWNGKNYVVDFSETLIIYTAVEINDRNELYYGWWGILLWACAMIFKVCTFIAKLVPQCTSSFAHDGREVCIYVQTLCNPMQNYS